MITTNDGDLYLDLPGLYFRSTKGNSRVEFNGLIMSFKTYDDGYTVIKIWLKYLYVKIAFNH